VSPYRGPRAKSLEGTWLESRMAPPDAPRPTRFDGAKGTGWTLSRWRKTD
jgi:hypothetical protein